MDAKLWVVYLRCISSVAAGGLAGCVDGALRVSHSVMPVPLTAWFHVTMYSPVPVGGTVHESPDAAPVTDGARTSPDVSGDAAPEPKYTAVGVGELDPNTGATPLAITDAKH